MNTWICSLKDDLEIKDIKNYETVLTDDIIFGYVQTIESGEFFIIKKLIKKENGQLENIDIEPIKIDLPYSIMYRCKSGKFLYKLREKEIDFLLDESSHEKDSNDEIEIDENSREKGGENIIYYGVPGSGKSHTIETEHPKHDYILEKLVFHPDYSYSDFVGQIMPALKDDGAVSYDFKPGPFTKILEKAYKNPTQKYLLVIDEINRGNAPAIFGEIFQLLDRDKDGNSVYVINNENIAKIVYGKNNTDKPIKIPSNLWIIATMNTSDQNVFTLDTAFQRRFTMRLIENSFKNAAKEFKELPILDTTITWENFCTTINSVITESGDNTSSMEDKRLGVYFLTENELKNKELFAYKVLKYLWDDVFKFDKGAFNSNFKTLEAIIVHFINDENSGDLQFDIFNDEIRAELAKNTK